LVAGGDVTNSINNSKKATNVRASRHCDALTQITGEIKAATQKQSPF
jgi:hypothetical protein